MSVGLTPQTIYTVYLPEGAAEPVLARIKAVQYGDRRWQLAMRHPAWGDRAIVDAEAAWPTPEAAWDAYILRIEAQVEHAAALLAREQVRLAQVRKAREKSLDGL